jgi:hypothetical protein
LIPFAEVILDLQVARRDFGDIDPAGVATALNELRTVIEETHQAVKQGQQKKKPEAKEQASSKGGRKEADEKPRIEATKTMAHRAAQLSGGMRETLDEWFTFYDGYHPSFSWWVRDPYQKVDKALDDYIKYIKAEILGEKEGEDQPIVGDPIGREALLEDLALEMIPYTPEELIAIAMEQFAWCDKEMLRASQEMGLGDDWHAALEKVKTLRVEPGEQPNLVHMLAEERSTSSRRTIWSPSRNWPSTCGAWR